jgi:hypothetical protein
VTRFPGFRFASAPAVVPARSRTIAPMNAATSRAWNIGRDPLSFAAITAEIPC